jgi:hypothetical protein
MQMHLQKPRNFRYLGNGNGSSLGFLKNVTAALYTHLCWLRVQRGNHYMHLQISLVQHILVYVLPKSNSNSLVYELGIHLILTKSGKLMSNSLAKQLSINGKLPSIRAAGASVLPSLFASHFFAAGAIPAGAKRWRLDAPFFLPRPHTSRDASFPSRTPHAPEQGPRVHHIDRRSTRRKHR